MIIVCMQKLKKGYRCGLGKKSSLAVQKDNYALCMYQRTGFKIIVENAEEFIMEYVF